MSGRFGAGRLVAPVGALLLVSCASAPEPAGPQERPQVSPAPAHAPRPRVPPQTELPLEQRERESAEDLMQQARWAEAIPHWEVLELLNPDQPAYAKKLAEAKSRAGAAATEHLQQARQARQQGQTDRAFVLYLKALSTDPSNAEAALALREIEREDARRAHSSASGRGGNGEPAMNPRKGSNAPPPSAAERRDQEAYLELARQRTLEGKKEEALTYLEKAQATRDAKGNQELTRSIQSLRKEIAEDYYQQGVRAQRTDLSEAISAWEKALKYDPDHPQAAQRLERARRMEENLRSIQNPATKP